MVIQSDPRGRTLLEEPDELGSRDAKRIGRRGDLEASRLQLVEGFCQERREILVLS
ncbi:MAG: hypothetical protein ACK52C_08290 [Planctomycetia bacterium]|jgi:hypothetical protein